MRDKVSSLIIIFGRRCNALAFMKSIRILMYALLIAITSTTGASAMWPFKMPVKLNDPISTLETFKKATRARHWRVAAQCLSDEIRQKNAAFLDRSVMYTTSYWQKSRGMESFLNDEPPLIEKDCVFKIQSLEANQATIEVVYPRFREKTVRLETVTVAQDSQGLWKIAEFFGNTVGTLSNR